MSRCAARSGSSARFGRALGRDMARQIDLERGALADLALHRDEAAGLLDDAVDGRKTKARAVADRLGGEERLENLGLVFRRDADAGVGDFDQHIVAGRHQSGADRARAGEQVAFEVRMVTVPPSGGMASRAFTTRLTIAFEIWPSSARTAQRSGACSNFRVTRSPSSRRSSSDSSVIVSASASTLRLQRLLAREGEQLAHQARGAHRVLPHLVDLGEGGIARRVAHQQADRNCR